jgi:hypothetical protein
VKEVTIWMSVTGQSSFSAAYPATLRVYPTGSDLVNGTNQLNSKAGGVTLPGNNGTPTAVTFSFATAIPKGSGSQSLFFKLEIDAPGTRKFQLWYASSGFANNSDCAKAQMYPGFPNLTTQLRSRGCGFS